MSRVVASRVIAVIAVGLSLAGCSSFDPYGEYDGYYGGYGDYAYGQPYGRYVRVRKCREVRDYYGQAFLECRYVKQWKPYARYAPSYPERRYGGGYYD